MFSLPWRDKRIGAPIEDLHLPPTVSALHHVVSHEIEDFRIEPFMRSTKDQRWCLLSNCGLDQTCSTVLISHMLHPPSAMDHKALSDPSLHESPLEGDAWCPHFASFYCPASGPLWWQGTALLHCLPLLYLNNSWHTTTLCENLDFGKSGLRAKGVWQVPGLL